MLSFVRHMWLSSCREFFCLCQGRGRCLFFTDLHFLLKVLLVRATVLASSSSRLSDWMGDASSTSSAANAFAVCVVVELVTLCGCTSCDLLWREPFLAPLCWLGLLTALLVFGCGGVYSFPIPAVVQSLWRCPSPPHFQHGPFFFGLDAFAFFGPA